MQLRLLLILLCGLALVSCKKADTAPDLAATVVGTYTLSSFSTTGTQPIAITDVTSGTAVATRNGNALTNVVFAINFVGKAAGVEAKLSQSQPIELTQSGSNIDLYSGTTKVGTYSNKVITVSNYNVSGFTVNFTATKP
ncbi:hypothetical protein [Spirosoma pollinicola]|uniref:Lipocalin-like domain-containing protein n=1 Tax=Spirosoma pollinicola TaxID=2057025 RepID=A0A2K8Z1L1_9BACT|nr:hypothetical protein [Spirosoma pollinicola]AUD03718.1 hypothetical protein CWM47_18925 [Spirosoma pollinicola]